jgi:hypothetical protein
MVQQRLLLIPSEIQWIYWERLESETYHGQMIYRHKVIGWMAVQQGRCLLLLTDEEAAPYHEARRQRERAINELIRRALLGGDPPSP